MAALPVGKLPADLLGALLSRYGTTDPRVLLRPGIGEDAAVIEMGERALVAKTDPVTFATDEIGWYAVHVSANDVACCGGDPRWYLATVLLPEHTATKELAENILAQIADACRQVGASLVGGHTEVTYGLDRPLVIGHMLGEVDKDRHISTGGAQVGDRLVLTGGFAVEGTAILAREKRSELQQLVSAETLDRCSNFLYEPGLSIVPEARLAREVGGLHAMHDPTEGGLATGLWELAEAAGVGLLLDEHQLRPFTECETFCRHFGLDPLGLIASGSLLIAVSGERAVALMDHLRTNDIEAREIGEVVSAEEGCRIRSEDGHLRQLPTFPRDEIARLFA